MLIEQDYKSIFVLIMLISRDGNAEASTSRSRAHQLDQYEPMKENMPLSMSGRNISHEPRRQPDVSSQQNKISGYSGTPTFLSTQSDILSSYPILSPSSRSVPPIPPQLHSMVSGAGAGLVASIVTCPLDVLKTALQASSHAAGSAEYEGVQKTAGRIWRQAGVRGFYRGLGPTLAGYLPTWGIYFTVYDLIKDRLGIWASDPCKSA